MHTTSKIYTCIVRLAADWLGLVAAATVLLLCLLTRCWCSSSTCVQTPLNLFDYMMLERWNIPSRLFRIGRIALATFNHFATFVFDTLLEWKGAVKGNAQFFSRVFLFLLAFITLVVHIMYFLLKLECVFHLKAQQQHQLSWLVSSVDLTFNTVNSLLSYLH